MKRIALTTYSGRTALTPSDEALVRPLKRRDIEVVGVPWDEVATWEEFDAVVIRSSWNYHLHPWRFRDWIEQVVTKGIPVLNTPSVLYWNMDKMYLKDLAKHGVPTIPTEWVCRENRVRNLKEVLLANNWENALIKPRIGASADFVWISNIEDAPNDQPRFEKMLQEHDLMVQPVIDEIRNGEWSLVFFDNQYSHSTLKRPSQDSYFVQKNHGGTYAIKKPSHHLINEAEGIIKTALAVLGENVPFLYARVDGVELNGKLHLMELELIEPELFLSETPGAAERFANAIADRVEAKQHV